MIFRHGRAVRGPRAEEPTRPAQRRAQDLHEGGLDDGLARAFGLWRHPQGLLEEAHRLAVGAAPERVFAREPAVPRGARVVSGGRPVVRERRRLRRGLGVHSLDRGGHAPVQRAPRRRVERREQAFAELVVREADLAVLRVEHRRVGARGQPLVEIGGGLERAEHRDIDLSSGHRGGLEQGAGPRRGVIEAALDHLRKACG